ncbi:MAG: protein-S-isoprenylcysteine O-methyltransferase [Bacteroidota bacterium]
MLIPTIALKVLFILMVVATVVIRKPHEKRNKDNTITQDNKTNLEKTLLAITSLGMMILPLVYLITPFLSFANYTLPLYVHLIGIAMIPFMLWLFYRSHKDLGRNWSVTLEIREDHTIVDTGVYKYIRHPMYTAIWIWVIIQALLLNNYIAGLSGIIGYGALYFFRVGREEAMMLEEFGQKYAEYKQRTKRLLPFLI